MIMASHIRQSGSKRIECKYKLRWFYSKGAFLVLVWFLLYTIAQIAFLSTWRAVQHNSGYQNWIYAVPGSVCILTVPPLGWLAHTKFGVYNTTKFGIVLSFLGTIMTCVFTLILDLVKNYHSIITITACLVCSLQAVGVAAFIVSVLQLGLDQMPDASSSNITSFIAWFLFNIFLSIVIGNFSFDRIWLCLDLDPENEADRYPNYSIQLWSLIPTSCMSLVVVTDFLFAKKWLIIEPKTTQTLKTVYRVLKFAWQHKAPVNRSALTYWEENVPSRMDLGKSRYGGPFTTEQVEDVKIVLRLLVLSIPLWVISFSVSYGPIDYNIVQRIVKTTIFPNWTACNTFTLYSFTYSSELWILITTVLFEFAIYPIVRDRLPSILKRIGIVAFINFILSVLFLILSLIDYFNESRYIILLITSVLFFSLSGIETYFFLSAVLELVCAQAPYNTRGFFTGYFIVAIVISRGLGFRYTRENFISYCTSCNIHLILFGVKCCISLFGLVVYCLLARWYKRRVRDEEYCTQTVVEEVYDRYLSQNCDYPSN